MSSICCLFSLSDCETTGSSTDWWTDFSGNSPTILFSTATGASPAEGDSTAGGAPSASATNGTGATSSATAAELTNTAANAGAGPALAARGAAKDLWTLPAAPTAAAATAGWATWAPHFSGQEWTWCPSVPLYSLRTQTPCSCTLRHLERRTGSGDFICFLESSLPVFCDKRRVWAWVICSTARPSWWGRPAANTGTAPSAVTHS